MLGVPYRSQNAPGAWRYGSDCGPACIGMELDYVGRGAGLTIDLLSAETSLAWDDDGLSCQALVSLGVRHGLHLAADAGYGLDALRCEIDAGRPVVALIEYRWILGRLDTYESGHFVTLTGYDDGGVYFNDPDYWGAYLPRGQNFYAPWSQFQLAYQAYLFQCVRVYSMSRKDEALARLHDALAAVESIVETNDTDQPGTAKTNTVNLNIRSGPGTTYASVGVLPSGSTVRVDTGLSGWFRIVAGAWNGRYVSADPQYWAA